MCLQIMSTCEKYKRELQTGQEIVLYMHSFIPDVLEELPGSNAYDDGSFLLLAFGASAHEERAACT